MSVEVRAASEADLDALIQLNRLVQNLHAALYPGDFKSVAEPSAVREFFAARLAGLRRGQGRHRGGRKGKDSTTGPGTDGRIHASHGWGAGDQNHSPRNPRVQSYHRQPE